MKNFAYILHRFAHNYGSSFSICANEMSWNETNEVQEWEQRFSSVVLQ